MRQLAQAVALQDESHLRYYEERIKAMPLQVLKGHGVVEEKDGLVTLTAGPLTYEQRARIKALCEERLGEHVAEHGMGIWDYRQQQVTGHESRVASQETVAGLAAEAIPEYRPHSSLARKPIKGAAHRNPPWIREELILALDLYFRMDPGQIDDEAPEVISLSIVLNALPASGNKADPAKYRNPNGVAMKLMNFRVIDPAQGGKGLSHGGKMEEEIWREFTGEREKLREAAREILRKVAQQ